MVGGQNIERGWDVMKTGRLAINDEVMGEEK